MLLFCLAEAMVCGFAFDLEGWLFALKSVFLTFSDHFGKNFLSHTEFLKRTECEHVEFTKSNVWYCSTSGLYFSVEFILEFCGKRVDVYMSETGVIETTKDMVSS